MEVLKFVVQYWVQFAFIIAALGYVAKVILDHSYKKKEIFYQLYASEEMKTIMAFFKDFYNAHIEMGSYIDRLTREDTSIQKLRENQAKLHIAILSFYETCNTAYIFFSAKSRENIGQIKANTESTVDNIGIILQSISDKGNYLATQIEVNGGNVNQNNEIKHIDLVNLDEVEKLRTDWELKARENSDILWKIRKEFDK